MDRPLVAKVSAVAALALLLQLLFLSRMPGLNADAAWKARRAHDTVCRGRAVVTGVNPGNGVLHEYLFALCFAAMGPTVFAIRLPFVLMNAAAVVLAWLFIRRFYDDAAGLICALMMAVYPWFVIKLRVAWPPSAIPFMTMFTLWLLSLGRPAAVFLGGAAMGLGCYDYQPFTALPLALLALLAIYRRRVPAALRLAGLFAAGAACGYAPKILACLCCGDRWMRGPLAPFPAVLGKAAVCVPYFLRIMDGGIVYLRTTGRIAVPVAPLNSVVLLGSIALLLRDRGSISRPLVAALCIFFALAVVPDTLTSTRYFIFAATAASLVSGLGVYRLCRSRRAAGVAVLKLFVTVNLFYLACNFFAELGRTGGSLAVFRSGNFDEMSHGYVRMDVLYDALDPRVAVVVARDPLIERNLRFYDIRRGRFSIAGAPPPGCPAFYLADFADGRGGGAAAFPGYEAAREHRELRNFILVRFTRREAPPGPGGAEGRER